MSLYPSVTEIRRDVEERHPGYGYPGLCGALMAQYQGAVIELEELRQVARGVLENKLGSASQLAYLMEALDKREAMFPKV